MNGIYNAPREEDKKTMVTPSEICYLYIDEIKECRSNVCVYLIMSLIVCYMRSDVPKSEIMLAFLFVFCLLLITFYMRRGVQTEPANIDPKIYNRHCLYLIAVFELWILCAAIRDKISEDYVPNIFSIILLCIVVPFVIIARNFRENNDYEKILHVFMRYYLILLFLTVIGAMTLWPLYVIFAVFTGDGFLTAEKILYGEKTKYYQYEIPYRNFGYYMVEFHRHQLGYMGAFYMNAFWIMRETNTFIHTFTVYFMLYNVFICESLNSMLLNYLNNSNDNSVDISS